MAIMESNVEVNPTKSEAITTKERAQTEPGITKAVMQYYQLRSKTTKDSIDQHAAEIMQRQEKMKLLNEVSAEINNLTNEVNQLDISQHPDIQEKLKVLADLGVKLNSDEVKFDSFQLIRLKENLQLYGDNWHKENQSQSQKLERLSQFLNQLVMLMKDALRCESNVNKRITGKI